MQVIRLIIGIWSLLALLVALVVTILYLMGVLPDVNLWRVHGMWFWPIMVNVFLFVVDKISQSTADSLDPHQLIKYNKNRW